MRSILCGPVDPNSVAVRISIMIVVHLIATRRQCKVAEERRQHMRVHLVPLTQAQSQAEYLHMAFRPYDAVRYKLANEDKQVLTDKRKPNALISMLTSPHSHLDASAQPYSRKPFFPMGWETHAEQKDRSWVCCTRKAGCSLKCYSQARKFLLLRVQLNQAVNQSYHYPKYVLRSVVEVASLI